MSLENGCTQWGPVRDEDIQFVDEEEIEDLDDFEYEEDWEDEPQK